MLSTVTTYPIDSNFLTAVRGAAVRNELAKIKIFGTWITDSGCTGGRLKIRSGMHVCMSWTCLA